MINPTPLCCWLRVSAGNSDISGIEGESPMLIWMQHGTTVESYDESFMITEKINYPILLVSQC